MERDTLYYFCIGTCSYRKTGDHFSGTCASDYLETAAISEKHAPSFGHTFVVPARRFLLTRHGAVMLWLVALALVVTGLIWVGVARVFLYRRLFSVSHLMEFAQELAPLKQAALLDLDPQDKERSPGDAPILRTSVGLALVYTVSTRSGGYVHHASVSLPGQATAHAVGATFILLWARHLGFDYGRLALRVSPSTVHHAELVLDEDEQLRFAAQPVEAPTAEWLRALQVECATARQSLHWERGPAAASR